MSQPVPQRLAHLTALWKRAASPWRFRVFLGAFVAMLMVGSHVARTGTVGSRAAVALALLALGVASIALMLVLQRRERDPIRVAKLIADKADPLLGDRAARAVRLVREADAGTDPVSTALARLHLEKLLSNVRPEHLWESGRRQAARARRVMLVLAVVALAGVAWGPWSVVEGLNVLIAYNGKAPVPLDWVDTVFCSTRPPRYLGQRDDVVMGFVPTRQPRGTLMSLHARQLHEGRQLVLTNGQMEVPFVDDGRGAVVAHWTVGDSAELRVAARFGDVLIEQRGVLGIETIEDYTPDVTLEGAPRTLALLEMTEVALTYEAIDDHGLTQVDLVLRAGEQESRRVLARHDGRAIYDQGSAVLRNDDAFLRRSHVPIEVTIEARDNDPVSGPKWGKSKALLIVPPAVGEPEVRRYRALEALRDEAVDRLAARLTVAPTWSSEERAAWTTEEVAAADAYRKKVLAGVNATYAGVDVPRRVRTLFVGQVDRMLAATKATCPAGADAKGCTDRHTALGKRMSNVVLALDIGVRSLATRDAQAIARRLADVAEEAAEGAHLARQPEQERGKARLTAALEVLRGGAKSLSVLDELGADLGEVTLIGVRRIERAWQRGDTYHAELAARDLAGRLRRPFPSFSGGGGRRGTEAGSMGGLDDQSAGAEAQDEMEQHGSALDELTRDHAAAMDELSKELAEALRNADQESLRDEAREHARRVRDSVASLPSEATDTSSLEGTAAVVRENAERMADAMERLGMSDAEQAGRNALRAAEQAGAIAKRERSLFGDETPVGRNVEGARSEVDRELAWVRDQLESMRRVAAERTKEDLGKAALEEDEMADRAQQLAERGREGSAPLPDGTIDKLEAAHRAMRDAARALRGADTQRGVEKQRDAQRLLETAREAQSARDDAADERADPTDAEDRANDDGDGREIARGHVDIPGADTFKGPEDFRRRVVDGLSDAPDPRLRDAIRRYAEGLLR